MLVPTGKGMKTVYFAYLFDAEGHAKETIGFPIDQRKAKIDPHVYTPEEIMDMAEELKEQILMLELNGEYECADVLRLDLEYYMGGNQ